MADSLFDATFDDFIEDHALFELANLTLPLPRLLSLSPSPSGNRLSRLEPPARPTYPAHSRFARRLLPPLADAPTPPAAGPEPSRPIGAGRGPSRGPTRPGITNPTTQAPRRPALATSRNLAPAASRSLPNRNPPPLQNRNSDTSTATRTATATHRGASFNRPLRGRPDFSPSAAARYEANRDGLLFLNELLARDFSSPSPFPSRSPSQPPDTRPPPNNPNSSRSSSPLFVESSDPIPAAGPAAPPASDADSDDLEAMSSNTRSKRAPRVGDLALPSVPSGSQATSSTAQRRSSRGSASRPSQQLQPRLQSTLGSSANKRKREDDDADAIKGEVDDDDLFGDKFLDEHEVVDLVDKEEVPEIRPQKPKNYVKLSALNCVICMDDVTDLTVTHCGHLFCSACLHSALNIDATKRVCPICRQKIDSLPSNGKWSTRAKGYYPLELKLMTRTALGKRAAQS